VPSLTYSRAAVNVIGLGLFGGAAFTHNMALFYLEQSVVEAWAYTAALPLFALAAPLPDTPLTSLLQVVVGAALVWLSTAVARPTVDRRAATTAGSAL
jgi:hypothetical protein